MPCEVLLAPSDSPGRLTPMALWGATGWNYVRDNPKPAPGSQITCREFTWLLLRLMCSFDVLLELWCRGFLPPLSALHPDNPALMARVPVSGWCWRRGILSSHISGGSCAGVVQHFLGCKGQFRGWICNFRWGFTAWMLWRRGAWTCGQSSCLQFCTSFPGWIFETDFCEFQAGASTYCKLHIDKPCCLRAKGTFCYV